MQITAKVEIEPYEQKLIEDYIKEKKEKHPNLELSMEDIYRTASRKEIDILLGQIRKERREKMIKDWINEAHRNKKKPDRGSRT